jgi:ferredoxin-type protein NapF
MSKRGICDKVRDWRYPRCRGRIAPWTTSLSSMVSRRQFLRGNFKSGQAPQRPPWALAEALFINACSRCGDCVPACPTRIIVIVRGFPEVDFKRGECTFCGACAAACKDKRIARQRNADLALGTSRRKWQAAACRNRGWNAASAAITARWPRSASAHALAGRPWRNRCPHLQRLRCLRRALPGGGAQRGLRTCGDEAAPATPDVAPVKR